MISIIASSAPGLSPLMRGTHMNVGSDRVFTRFIPAGAGNTHECRFRPCFYPVYPRWRGEHSAGPFQIHNRFGLSPLARGTLLLTPAILNGWRFIPAGAGNTSASASVNIPVTVYPRWRGEHRAIASSMFTTFGLSPLARGTHDAAMSFSWASRFIPAGAGNTADRSV